MAYGIQNQSNIEAADSAYPNGSIRDKTISLPGTGVSKRVYDDFHQFFAKMLRMAAITPSNQPDNETNGFQYINALRKNRAVGEYISFDRSSSLVLSGQNSPLVKIAPGSPNSGDISLQSSASASNDFDLGIVTIINASSFSCDIFPGGSDTIEGVAGSTILTAGSSIKLMQIIAEANWIIIP